ncbi:MAG: 3-oxoacyl-ACP reductase [Betaproteobacteria bacterium RIFCSPLOWO2_02_FULL_67_26]|nr:MAG: 3-oxoacyl-ACP reductase [Betaproteobacteria bacterium RIFCSPLOWO2_02_FULL_67_26]
MASGSKTALVTGAGTGVGKAVALAFLKDGYRVALAGRRKEMLEQTVKEAGAAGGNALAVPTDVGKPEQVAALFRQIKDRFGRIDVVFNNAGGNAPGVAFEDLPFEKWQSVVDVNLTGMFLCAQAAFRMMKDQDPRGGRIINNGSISAHTPRPGSAPYTATKHGVTGLTKTISLDGRPYDIACGQVDIGNAISPMTERMAQGVKQANGTTAPEPRMDPAHVGNAVVFMANLPLDVNVLTMTIMATKMPFVGRG